MKPVLKKLALITGASGGIGRELVKKFVLEGYFTIGTFNTDFLSESQLMSEITEEGGSPFLLCMVKADLSTKEGIEKVMDIVQTNFSHVDVFVSNAGVSLYKQIQDTTDEDYDYVMNVNARAPYLITREILPPMISKKTGSIIYVSSVWGDVGASMETAYSQSKASLIGLTKALAKELAPSNIRVNCVCPGVIDTKMNARFTAEEKQDIINEIPMSRMGTAKEIAELIYFLATEKSSYITGQVIKADGGYTL